MESMQQSEYTEGSSPEVVAAEAQTLKETEQLKVDVNVDQPGAITKLPPPNPSTDQPWQEWDANGF
jgi:hypothetical protein